MDKEQVLIRVSFEASSVDELKLKVQEYSLAHLGLNLVALSDLRQPMGAPAKKRGRPVGWRKEKSPEASVDSEAANISSINSASHEASGFTRDDVKDAIHRLNDARGFQIAAKALAKFDAKHLNEVSEGRYADLITHCEELINEPGPDGAA